MRSSSLRAMRPAAGRAGPAVVAATTPAAPSAHVDATSAVSSKTIPQFNWVSKNPEVFAHRHLPHVVQHFSPIIMARGEGTWIWDIKGEKYLDSSAGLGVMSTGHSHPKVVQAVQKQAGEYIHAQQNVVLAHTRVLELIEKMLPYAPAGMDTFLFTNSGSEAIENAVKIARAHTRRPNVISFEGGFHGRSYCSLSLTSTKTSYRRYFAPLMGGTYASMYPHCLHCKARKMAPDDQLKYRRDLPFGGGDGFDYGGECCGSYKDHLEFMLRQISDPAETCAIIVEPILGEGGIVVPPSGFLQHLRQICDKHGILLIFDEVQCGVGRAGEFWAHTDVGAGVVPDILCFAKGIGSGLPMGGNILKARNIEGLVAGSLGSTYGGNALGCAASIATIEVIEEENLLQNAKDRGAQIGVYLNKLREKFPIIDLRGRGLMLGMEFDPNAKMRSSISTNIAKAIIDAGFQEKMLLLPAGPRETVRLLPPLTISEEETHEMLTRLETAMQKVFAR